MVQLRPGSAKNRTRRTRYAALPAAALMLVAGCGGSPTAGGGGGNSNADSATSLEQVYAELDGLDGDTRDARLVELAKAEDGKFTVYLTTNERESKFFLEGFSQKYGIEIETYRASSTDLQQRLVEEADAGYRAGADLVMTNEPEMFQMDSDTHLFLPFNSPTTAGITPSVVHPNFVGYSANAFVVAWNTNAISADKVPKTFEDVLTKHSGGLVMEITDWEWFGSLVQQYFVEKLGWTEEKAVELFKKAARGAAMSDGHTLMNTMVIAGEYDVSASSYFNRTEGDVQEGAPIAWEPAVAPMLVRPAAFGIHKFVDRPATALLFGEYMLTDAQMQMAENNFVPLLEKGAPNPLEDYEVIYQDTKRLLAESAKWLALYEQVVRQAKGDVLTD